MKTRWITLTEHFLKEEMQTPTATGKLTLILTQIAEASKIIASQVKNSGLVNIEGLSGNKNTYEEEVKKLDELANSVLMDLLLKTGHVGAVASEELSDLVASQDSQGEYVVYFDPLDGSGNVENNHILGTIFSIYKKGDGKLPKGSDQVAAGYIMYGSSVIFVYTTGHGVNGFTLDPSVGSFLLSHENIRVPEKGITYGVNEGSMNLFDDKTRDFINSFKEGEKPYRLRYAACMVADIHRVLLDGGYFMYPSDSKAQNGKLRLMFEVNPMAYIITQAGGMARSGTEDPLAIMPEKLHQQVPVILGGTYEIKKYLTFRGE